MGIGVSSLRLLINQQHQPKCHMHQPFQLLARIELRSGSNNRPVYVWFHGHPRCEAVRQIERTGISSTYEYIQRSLHAVLQQATAIVQDHYVERSNRMFIVNAPSYFSLIW